MYLYYARNLDSCAICWKNVMCHSLPSKHGRVWRHGWVWQGNSWLAASLQLLTVMQLTLTEMAALVWTKETGWYTYSKLTAFLTYYLASSSDQETHQCTCLLLPVWQQADTKKWRITTCFSVWHRCLYFIFSFYSGKAATHTSHRLSVTLLSPF